MSLWLCLRFDSLPLETLLKQRGESDNMAVIVAARRRVVICNELACLAGVLPGQSISTAQALLVQSEYCVLERAPQTEEALLKQLTVWAYGLSPHLQRWRDNALMLEIGSCLRLHHGLEALLNCIDKEMCLRGLTVAMGVAETRAAAWLLSHAERDIACHPEKLLTERLGPMPLHLIEADFPAVLKRLEKTGLRQFRQLLDIPPSALGKRCGEPFLNWLNQLTGNQQEPVITYQPPQRFEDTLWFGFDIQNRQELHPAMQRLLTHFCQFLMNTQLCSGVIEWRYLQPQQPQPQQPQTQDTPSETAYTAFKVFSDSAQKNAALWLELSRLQLENQSLPEGIEGLSLIVEELQEARTAPQDLFHAGVSTASRYELVDRLRSRLGLQAVGYLDSRSEHLPEDAVMETHTLTPRNDTDNHPLGQRPFWLLPAPQPIHQSAEQLYWNGALDILHGPERIEDQWWHAPVSRDYYIACTPQKQPVWIYQDRHNRRWYLHGLFA
ncbi:MAG: DNA polymerase Y family protein [Luminiphilus sp.]|jgi:protein ImuB|nr:DNA polymerase Y family protein [Luminiphilus sp.]